jgi:membrane protein DedA with SNARE-associated domain
MLLEIALPTGGLAVLAYLIIAGIIGAESMGVPLPGETTLIGAGLLASQDKLSLTGVIVAAASGAIVGDSIGYVVGRRAGRSLFDRLGRRSHHFGEVRIAAAERYFERFGVWTVFFGRFVALLRILAGPMAGTLRMHYPRFLAANASGGIVWAGLTAVVAYKIGDNADKIFGRVSMAALAVVAVALLIAYVVYRRRRNRSVDPAETGAAEQSDAA